MGQQVLGINTKRKRKVKAQVFVAALLVFAISIILGLGLLATSRSAYMIQEAYLDALRSHHRADSASEMIRKNLEADFYGFTDQSFTVEMLGEAGGIINAQVSAPTIADPDERDVSIGSSFGNANSPLKKTYKQISTIGPVCWVVDQNVPEIIQYDDKGNQLSQTGGFAYPIFDVDLNAATGECWVVDNGNDQIVKLNNLGQEQFRISGFDNPQAIAVNETTGEVWVADTTNDQVVKLDPGDGSELYRSPSGWPAEFNAPYDIDVDNITGECWVADYHQGDIARISADGSQIDSFEDYQGTPFQYVYSVAVDTAQHICWFGARYGAAAVIGRIDPSAAPGSRVSLRTGLVGRPGSLAVNPNTGECWVLQEGNNGKVTKYAAQKIG